MVGKGMQDDLQIHQWGLRTTRSDEKGPKSHKGEYGAGYEC